MMNAVVLRSFGGPELLELADLPRPHPGPAEVLIHVRAAGVNPVDTKMRSGRYSKNEIKLPVVLGRDVSGIVESVGLGVTYFKPGDEVYAFLKTHGGGYAQYAVAKENEVAPKPKSLDFVHAAAVPLAATTAWQALFDQGQLQPGQRVLIHGAAGGVGHFAVQFAYVKGAFVIATGTAEDATLLKELGADQAIDYHHERFEEVASNIDLVIDLIGGDTQERSWQVLKRGGALISTVQQPSADRAREIGARAKVFVAEPRQEQLVAIGELIDEGKVGVKVKHTRSLAETRFAHEELENEHTAGKLVLTVP